MTPTTFRTREEALAFMGIDPEATLRAAAKESLREFMGRMLPHIPAPPHRRVLTDLGDAVTRDARTRILISLPPQHIKSSTMSIALPAFYLGAHPDRRVILASYSAEKAQEFSRKARDLVMDQRYPWHGDVSVSESSAAVSLWSLMKPHTGQVVATGIGGSLTGFGANLIIYDDPIKGPEEANSETERNKAWDMLTTVLMTRQNNPCCIIIIATRWHEDDVIGRIKARFPEDWHDIVIPAIADATITPDGDPMGRADGEPLWAKDDGGPVDYDEQKKVLGIYWFGAIYQGNPIPEKGNFFNSDHERTFTVDDGYYALPDGIVAIDSCARFATADTAFSLKQQADYTAIGLWALTPKRDLLLLDVIRVRAEEEGILELLRTVVHERRAGWVAVEKTGYSTRVIEMAVAEGLPIRSVIADTDKRTRAMPARILMENHKLLFRKDAEYLNDLKPEMAAFPNGTHDDQVDMISIAVAQGMDAQDESLGDGWPKYEFGRKAA